MALSDEPQRRSLVEEMFGKESVEEAENRKALLSNGFHVTCANGEGVSVVWPHLMGAMPFGTDTLAIVTSFCLITLHGHGVAALRERLIDRKITAFTEGAAVRGVTVERIRLDWNLPRMPAGMAPEAL